MLHNLAMEKCKWYLCENKRGVRSEFCSRKCDNKSRVTRKRRELKSKAVEYLGGQCVHCGYKKSNRALEFHHTNPKEKDFTIGSGYIKSWEKMQLELDKCILLCRNCHAEEHERLYDNLIGNSLLYTKTNIRENIFCIDCGDKLAYFTKRSALRCRPCLKVFNRKITHTQEEVRSMVANSNINRTAKSLGVSFLTIKRYIQA